MVSNNVVDGQTRLPRSNLFTFIWRVYLCICLWRDCPKLLKKIKTKWTDYDAVFFFWLKSVMIEMLQFMNIGSGVDDYQTHFLLDKRIFTWYTVTNSIFKACSPWQFCEYVLFQKRFCSWLRPSKIKDPIGI